jgi:hypothetical protein
MRQLTTVNMPSLGESRLKELQRREYKQERAFVKTRLAKPDLIHQPIAKPEFSHRSSLLTATRKK